MMKMHILTDNRVMREGLLAEHGMSIFIEHPEKNILFDTGQSDVYCRNAAQMGIDLSRTQAIVLSHGHYDHCGGLADFPQSEQFPKIYVHETALEEHFAINADGTYREIGIPWTSNERQNFESSLILTQKNKRIAPGIELLGEVPATANFEGVPEGFYVDRRGKKVPDSMNHEQMLIFDTEQGLMIFLGCSHPGIINCMEEARRQFHGKKIHTVVAGMHLDHASAKRLNMTIKAFQQLDIKRVIPLHCTGSAAICEMKRYLGDRCLVLRAGDSLEL